MVMIDTISADLMKIVHRPQSFMYILDESDPSRVMSLLLSGFWVKRNPAHILTKHPGKQLTTPDSGKFAIFARHDVKIEVWVISMDHQLGAILCFSQAHPGETRWPRPASHARGRPRAQACCRRPPPLLHHSLPVTGFAVDLRRSWSYYAIFVFFL